MLTDPLRNEEKSLIIRRHGKVKHFAAQYGLKTQAVSDYLRGRTSAPVREAIEVELQAAQQDESSVKLVQKIGP